MTAARRLAAILAADVVGCSRLMGEDKAGTAKFVRINGNWLRCARFARRPRSKTRSVCGAERARPLLLQQSQLASSLLAMLIAETLDDNRHAHHVRDSQSLRQFAYLIPAELIEDLRHDALGAGVVVADEHGRPPAGEMRIDHLRIADRIERLD